ncbi:MAG: hypothetical protein ABIK68_12065 [bacterium]
MVKEEDFNQFILNTMYEIIECKDIRSSSTLHAYTRFLNKKTIRYDYIPLYLKIFKTNNRYTIDALLSGYVAQNFFDFIRVPNIYVLKHIFEILAQFQKNALYQQTQKVFFGFLKRVYRSAGEGFRIYAVTIADVNNLGKFLDEGKTQNNLLNRDILDILFFFTELDEDHENGAEKGSIARHASRIRSDFFDQKRSLKQSMTEVFLQKSADEGPGISPEGAFFD